jgi:hypothetical protein
LALARFLRSKPYDIAMIVLIVLYTILILVIFSLLDQILDNDDKVGFYIVELVLLGLFLIEIALHIIAFGKLYIKDLWSIFDFFIIVLSVVFVFLDIYYN